MRQKTMTSLTMTRLMRNERMISAMSKSRPVNNERVQRVCAQLGQCIHDDEEHPYCPYHSGVYKGDECNECEVEDCNGPIDSTICWVAFVTNKPMPVEHMNKKYPPWTPEEDD